MLFQIGRYLHVANHFEIKPMNPINNLQPRWDFVPRLLTEKDKKSPDCIIIIISLFPAALVCL